MDRHAGHVTNPTPNNSMTESQGGAAQILQGLHAEQAAHGSVAVIVPCHNEAATIAQVVQEFRRSLPIAQIYVYDNGSTDDTAQIARNSGAIVRDEPLPGKGNVVRRMFADVEADIYLMVDGDGTYDATAAPRLVARLVSDGLDMVNCARVPTVEGVYRPGHRFRRSKRPDRSGGARGVRQTSGRYVVRIPSDVSAGSSSPSLRSPPDSKSKQKSRFGALELRAPTAKNVRALLRKTGGISEQAAHDPEMVCGSCG